ncbi:MAG: dihydropteroate synthase [Alphaproteobacteria bacterium]|nr:dihydropteroate synthase [Alphaproteobacteria bacterium]
MGIPGGDVLPQLSMVRAYSAAAANPAGPYSRWSPIIFWHHGAFASAIPLVMRRFERFPLDRPLVMGIVNATPDSFSDGGDHYDTQGAIAHGLRLKEEGADILDIGGESTRPGADPVPEGEEIRRVVPVIEALVKAGAVVSIDTWHAGTMRAALDAGAALVNDVTALSGEEASLPLVAARKVGVVLMHMQGEPRTMQKNPTYADAPRDIARYLAGRVAACRGAGIAAENIAIDPGIGFGKTVAHNAEILANVPQLRGLGVAVLIGASRKAFIGALSKGERPKERLPGSIAAALAAVSGGADILRVHDVAATRQALAVWQAIEKFRNPT